FPLPQPYDVKPNNTSHKKRQHRCGDRQAKKNATTCGQQFCRSLACPTLSKQQCKMKRDCQITCRQRIVICNTSINKRCRSPSEPPRAHKSKKHFAVAY